MELSVEGKWVEAVKHNGAMEAVTTSLMVAKVFGKEHKHVLKAIDDLKVDMQKFGKAEFSAVSPAPFWEGIYHAPNSYKNYRQVYMNRKGATLLLMGFTGKKALEFKLKYIDTFDAMEEHLHSIGKRIQLAYR